MRLHPQRFTVLNIEVPGIDKLHHTVHGGNIQKNNFSVQLCFENKSIDNEDDLHVAAVAVSTIAKIDFASAIDPMQTFFDGWTESMSIAAIIVFHDVENKITIF